MANTVDSISHAHFRSNFQTPEVETEIVEMKQMRQMQDRGTHNYRQQMRDPDQQTDLQSDLQEDLHPDLQVDLQKDLQANLQMDLQVNLQVRTGQHSPLVLFQAETSTEETYIYGRNL